MQKSISLPPKSRFTLSNLQNLLAFHKNPLFFYENVTKLFSSERCKSSFYSFLRSRVLVAPSGYMLRIIGIYFLTQCSPYSHCQSSVHGAPSFRYSSRPRCFAAAWWFRLRGRELRPEDACQKRFSWFSDWNPKVQKFANLVRSALTRICLQKPASIQLRTGLSKMGKNWPNVRKS